jgi:hypothetical protein
MGVGTGRIRMLIVFACAAIIPSTQAIPMSNPTDASPASQTQLPIGRNAMDNEVHAALADIANGMRALKSRYPQLSDVDKIVLTESQLTYEFGRVVCQSKARPCTFGPNACRVTVELSHSLNREDVEGRAGVPRLIPLRDGSFLSVDRIALAEPTPDGRAFANAVQTMIDARVLKLRRQLDAADGKE